MRVRAVIPLYPPYSLVGSWLSTHELLAALVREGHEVEVHAYSVVLGAPLDHDGVRVVTSRTHLSRTTPDVIVGHAGDDGSAADVATRLDVPLVLMAHGGEPHMIRERLRPASLVVFNAHAFAAEVAHDGPQLVCHPFVDPARYATTRGDRVTLINCCEEKGASLFWALADARPDVEFLAVRGNYGRQQLWSGYPNVRFQRVTPNVTGEVYAQTSVLLMPSERETYGRVALEAACSGIPTIAHPHPGVVEAMGEAALYAHRENLDAWVEVLDELLTSSESYAIASLAALARASALPELEALSDFESALQSVCAREVVA